MKHVIVGLFLVLFLPLNSCSAVMGEMLTINPEFAETADTYLISHPSSRPSSALKPVTFTLEDGLTNDIYEMKVTWSKETNTEGSIVESQVGKGDKAKQRDFVAHKGLFLNPIDGKSYEIIGTTTTHRSLERHSNDMTEETSTMSYPLKFTIFQQGQEVGTVTVNESSLPLGIEVLLHDRLVYISHQIRSNQRQVALEFEDEQIAFFDLKTDGVVVAKSKPKIKDFSLDALMDGKVQKYSITEFKGNAYLTPGMTRDFIADIFTFYIIADTMMGIVIDKG